MSSLFLIGFMASGKSAVSLALSKALGMPWIDLDREIETSSGSSIPAIFASEGEEGFRNRERAILHRILSGPDAIVATGGGTACFADNLQRMKDSGNTIYLSVSLSTALARAKKQQTERPLLAKPTADIASLYRSRLAVYRRAQITVSTENTTIDRIVSDIDATLCAINGVDKNAGVVSLGQRSYPIVVRENCLDEIGSALRRKLPTLGRVAIITDDNVHPLYGRRVVQSLTASDISASIYSVEPGESSKSIEVFREICEQCISGGLDRQSAILALGGGVVGDLAGFVAASLFRGIPFVQIPTTLLAMTDSAIGGKTGINSIHGKNLIGAFWQPKMVWIDPMTLDSLPIREGRAAFGELVKYALLDSALWPMVQSLASAFGKEQFDAKAMGEPLKLFVSACANLKASIVSSDELEQGERALLNLGHTVGHAIEKSAGYGDVLHGEAVALGLLATCRISHRLGLCAANLESRIAAVLECAGLDCDLSTWLTPSVLQHMAVDKKRSGSKIRFIAVADLGDVRPYGMELDALTQLLVDKSTSGE